MVVLVWVACAAACVAVSGAASEAAPEAAPEAPPEAPPEAAVRSGRMIGKWLQSRQGRDIAAFEGIPFAAPPVGELRFRAPQPPEPWGSAGAVLQATQPGPMCTQRNLYAAEEHVVGQEDCLYLNVYAPEGATRDKPLDVLVFIHGGGWMCGSGDEEQPEYFLDHDVIFVSLNYRLGPLGFLSTEDEVIPGNSGLKDQVLALRWVRDNIAAFGGNPESVTIAGESAGGMSVHMLVLSPLARGLFHKAIPQSGNALMEMVFSPPGQARRGAARLAELLQCPAAPSEALRKCLLAKSGQEITAAGLSLAEWGMHPHMPFKAVAERPSSGGPEQEAFIDRHPRDVLRAGDFNDVPLMTGVTSHEGCLFAVGIHENDTALEEFNERFDSLLPMVIFNHQVPEHVLVDSVKRIRKFYYGDGPITHASKESTIDLLSDPLFVWPTLEAVQLHAKHGKSPVYLYEFAYPSRRSFSQILGSKGADYGVCHGDDVYFLFPSDLWFPGIEQSEDDVATSKKFVEFFVNFSKTGRPTADGTWKRVSRPLEAEYLHIGAPGQTGMRANYTPDRVKLWAELALRTAPSGRDEL